MKLFILGGLIATLVALLATGASGEPLEPCKHSEGI